MVSSYVSPTRRAVGFLKSQSLFEMQFPLIKLYSGCRALRIGRFGPWPPGSGQRTGRRRACGAPWQGRGARVRGSEMTRRGDNWAISLGGDCAAAPSKVRLSTNSCCCSALAAGRQLHSLAPSLSQCGSRELSGGFSAPAALSAPPSTRVLFCCRSRARLDTRTRTCSGHL